MAGFDVFISHSHIDSATANAACARLEAANIRCWMAPRDVNPGTEWAPAIVDAIDQCRVFVLIFSSNANNSRQVRREVQQAFEREVAVLPFRIEDVRLEKSMNYYMKSVHWLDALTPPVEAHLDQLAAAVEALLAAHAQVPELRINGKDEHSSPEPASRQLAAGILPKRVDAFLTVAAGVSVIISFIALLLGITPPLVDNATYVAGFGVAVLTSLVSVIVVLYTAQFAGLNTKATVNRILAVTAPSFLICSLLYLLLFSFFTYEQPAPNLRAVKGFICQTELSIAEMRECPLFDDSLIAGTGYHPELLWKPWSIDVMDIILIVAWFASFAFFTIAIGALVVKVRRRRFGLDDLSYRGINTQ